MNGASFARLAAESRAVAEVELLDKGIEAGDRVASTVSGTDFARLLWACAYVGAVLVPVNTRLTDRERADLLESVDPKLSIGEIAITRGMRGPCRTQVDPHAPFVLLHTSGTSGRPKAVELTYGNFHASALANQQHLGVEHDDRWLCCMPLFHVGGLSILTRSVINQTETVIHEGFDVERVKTALENEQITLVSLVPTQLSRLLDAGLSNPPQLRAALLGGGPVPPGLVERARAAGIEVIPTYGMTETCSQVWTGKPLPGAEIANGADGELLIRGPMVSAKAVAEDGWLHTGDRGHMDAQGNLTVDGRIADTIVTGGENVSATEVEQALLTHPAVHDAAVVGRPDPEWGQAIHAFVVAVGDVADIDAHLRQDLAGYKVPKRIERIDEIPRNAAGKILRGRLPQ